MKTEVATSAGGVVFRPGADGAEVALIATDDSGTWKLPKGTLEKGESLEHAALREVNEETGLTGELIDAIDVIDYWFVWRPQNTRFHKFVHFFLIRHTGGDEAKHDFEVKEVRWFPLDKASDMLTYKGEKAVLEKAKAMIGELLDADPA